MKRKTILTHLFMLLLLPSGLFPVTETVSDKGSGGSTLVLDIERAVGMAVSNSFELKEIMAREEVYDLVIDENFREYFPSVTFSYMQTDEVRIRAADSRQAKISVNGEFVLLDGGRRSLNYNVAKLNALVAGNDYRIALGRLIVQVRTAFLNLLRLKDSITIYRMTLDMGNMQLGFIRRECELGDATRLAVMEIEARISEIELSLKEAIDSYESDLKQFKLLLRIDWRIPVLIQGDLNSDFIFISPDRIDENEMISLAVRKRKEVESSRVRSEISRMNMEIAESYYMPNLSVGLNYSLSGEEFPPREKGWGVNVKLSTAIFGNTAGGGAGYNEDGNGNSRACSRNAYVNIMDNMQYKRAIAETRIDYARSDDEQKVTVESISVEVVNICHGIKNAWEMIEISRRRFELYNSQLEIEKLKAEMGESRRYDLVEKEIEWSRAAVALVDSKIKYLT
ncbi:MAG: TolC family protein, partial [Spirochaetes bacterium]|nr:TolC family protein [Spirochaetota bacterium]